MIQSRRTLRGPFYQAYTPAEQIVAGYNLGFYTHIREAAFWYWRARAFHLDAEWAYGGTALTSSADYRKPWTDEYEQGLHGGPVYFESDTSQGQEKPSCSIFGPFALPVAGDQGPPDGYYLPEQRPENSFGMDVLFNTPRTTTYTLPRPLSPQFPVNPGRLLVQYPDAYHADHKPFPEGLTVPPGYELGGWLTIIATDELNKEENSNDPRYSPDYTRRIPLFSEEGSGYTASATLTVTEFWPYADDEGTPYYDTATGARIRLP